MVQVVSTYHAPGAFKGCLLFLSAIDLFFTQFLYRRQFFSDGSRSPSAMLKMTLQPRQNNIAPGELDPPHYGIGMALGSTSGSVGEIIGDGEGVGVGNGVSTSPLFVVNTAPESVTSSTK